MRVRLHPEIFRVRIRRDNAFAQPLDKRGFVLGVESPEAPVLANLGTLVSLCTLAPVSVIAEGSRRHARLSREWVKTLAATSSRASGKRPSSWKDFSRMAKLRSGV